MSRKTLFLLLCQLVSVFVFCDCYREWLSKPPFKLNLLAGMAGPSNQSATVTPRRGGDTPLASIRPMSVQNSRTAAVLPTSQTTNVASIHGSSSSTSSGSSAVTALVPPQQVHSASGGMTGEVMSTTSSHTDYMPATSSATSIVVAAVSPMGKSFTTLGPPPFFVFKNRNKRSIDVYFIFMYW